MKNQITIDLLEEEIKKLKQQNLIDSENSYRNGFSKGMKIEIHVCYIDGNEGVSEETISEIRESVREKIKDIYPTYEQVKNNQS